MLLFVLVGAAVDVRYTLAAGTAALAMIALALMFRAAGVCLCMAGTALNRKERLFCVIAYLPKATVQAAIGSVPLAMGLPCGRLGPGSYTNLTLPANREGGGLAGGQVFKKKREGVRRQEWT